MLSRTAVCNIAVAAAVQVTPNRAPGPPVSERKNVDLNIQLHVDRGQTPRILWGVKMTVILKDLENSFLPADFTMPVWRYMHLDGLLATIRSRTLRFRLLHTLANDDPFETTVPRQVKDADMQIAGQLDGSETMCVEDSSSDFIDNRAGRLDKLCRDRRAVLRSAYACCWRLSDHENIAMWNLYCLRSDGIALRSTFGELNNSLVQEPERTVELVQYINYKTEPLKRHRNHRDPSMHKWNGFEHEQEVRALHCTESDYKRACADESFIPLDDYIDVPWKPEDVVHSIVISPYTPYWYETAAIDAIQRVSHVLAGRVCKSEYKENPGH